MLSLHSYANIAIGRVYGVCRAVSIGMANIADRECVYDDQEWSLRELRGIY